MPAEMSQFIYIAIISLKLKRVDFEREILLLLLLVARRGDLAVSTRNFAQCGQWIIVWCDFYFFELRCRYNFLSIRTLTSWFQLIYLGTKLII